MFKTLLLAGSLVLPQCAPPRPTPPPNVVEAVNSATYSYGDAAPALAAYRQVAAHRGWTPASIAAWEPFVSDVMRGESGYCYNLRRGATLKHTTGCVLARQGTGSDSGFGQVIRRYHYGPGQYLCVQEGLCSAQDVIATPWSSMTSLVAAMERNGRQPWCYNAQARRFHPTCNRTPGWLPLDPRWGV